MIGQSSITERNAVAFRHELAFLLHCQQTATSHHPSPSVGIQNISLGGLPQNQLWVVDCDTLVRRKSDSHVAIKKHFVSLEEIS